MGIFQGLIVGNRVCIFSLSLSSLGYSYGHQSDESMGRVNDGVYDSWWSFVIVQGHIVDSADQYIHLIL